MHWDQSRGAMRPFLAGLFTLLCAALLAGRSDAQPGIGSQLPQPRLFVVTPPGAKAGSVVGVTFTGTDLEEPESLVFSHPGIKAEPMLPPAPAPADPKNPAPKPAMKGGPKPVVTRFKVTVPADAPVGIHDVRLFNKWGISNPRAFVVGDLPEVLEKEPNNDVDTAQRVELNTTINGSIASATDVDFYVFAGKKGQRVVVSCLASSIDSRLQGALEFYDGKGKLLAVNRNYNDTDSLVDATLPVDGDYYVRLCEFTYTLGSPEYFYRLTISTTPWIDAVHPAIVEPGKPAKLTIYGRNLPDGKLDPTAVVDGRPLEVTTVTINGPNDPLASQRLTYGGQVPPKASFLDGFEYRVRNATGWSNPFLLTYARAPVVLDNEHNDTADTAQEVSPPCEIAGRIEKRRDKDWYTFSAKKGEIYNIEVTSDRCGAPTAMHFVLRNPATKQDIFETPVDNPDILNPKFFARTEDPPSYKFTVPADGKYHLCATSRHGDMLSGPRHLYRLRITPEQPDFRLVLLGPGDNRPDACSVPQGGSQDYTVFAWRLEGFSGDIALSAEGLPKGVTCLPQSIGAGLRHTVVVLTAAADAPAWVGDITIKGTATIKGQKVVREARAGSIVWPVQPQQNIPALGRVDRRLVLAVCDKAPYNLVASLDKTTLIQGEKGSLSLKLARLWPDFKTPLTIQAQVANLPPNNTLTINNNQPFTLAADKTDGTMVVDVKTNAPPGIYTVVLRTQGQVPYNKDPMAKQKQPIAVVLPSTPVTLTVLPKSVATLSLSTTNSTIKIGMQGELVVKVTRQFDYAGEFKIQLVLPLNAKGISAADIVIPAGQDEAKLMLKAAPDAMPGNRADLIVRAVAMANGTVPITHEIKFAVNVVK